MPDLATPFLHFDPKDEDEDEGMSVGTLMAGIAGITVLGLTVLTLSGGKSNE